jgi:release factor glutamine methyltransferase
MTARAAAAHAARRLGAAGVPDPALEGEYLARHAGGLSRASFFAGALLTEEGGETLAGYVDRRIAREPSPYITGAREFYGLEFGVGPGVLVPRPETEMLVDIALEELQRAPRALVADSGTGSGCVAVAVAVAAAAARVVATDVSPAALAVARQNARNHGADVAFILGDLLTGLTRCDIVLANLPYIPAGEIDQLEPEVSRWEPRVALDGGADGFSLIHRLIDDCATRLRPRLLALEVGYGQAEAVAAYARQHTPDVTIRRDLAGIDRIVCVRWA